MVVIVNKFVLFKTGYAVDNCCRYSYCYCKRTGSSFRLVNLNALPLLQTSPWLVPIFGILLSLVLEQEAMFDGIITEITLWSHGVIFFIDDEMCL